MRKFILVLTFLILFSGFVSANLSDGLTYYYGLDNSSFSDQIGGNDLVVGAGSITISSIAMNGNSSSFDGGLGCPSKDILTASSGITNYPNTICGWSKADLYGIGEYGNPFGFTDPTNGNIYYSVGYINGVFQMLDRNSAGTIAINAGSTNGAWVFMCAIRSNSTFRSFYVNGTQQGNSSTSKTFDADTITLGVERETSSNQCYDGLIDEVMIWNRSLSSSEVSDLYNLGSGLFYPFSSVVPSVVDSIENTVLFKQVGEVLVSGSGFTTIMNNSFEIFNSTNGYFAYSSSILANNNNVAECRFLVDGVLQQSSINRSNSAGVSGNFHIVGTHEELAVGNHTNSFQCKKLSGGGNFRISETVGIGHFEIDESNINLTHNFIHAENHSFNSSSFVLLDSSIMVLSNKSNSSSVEKVLYSNWGSAITHDAVGNITTKLSVDGVDCAEYVRSGLSGDEDSTGGNCLVRGFSANQSVNISIFVKGIGDLSHFHVHTTEFMVARDEVGNVSLNNTQITSSVLSKLAEVNISHSDHANVNIVVKAGLPVVSNAGDTTDSFQFRLSGDATRNGSVFSKDVLSTSTIIVAQDIFENVGVGNYSVELWGECAIANCSIIGGEIVAYISDVTTAFSLAFNLSVFDAFDNGVISNFSATLSDGSVFISTVGFALITSGLLSDNITVDSNFSGGYFSNSSVNHNTSNDLSLSLAQSFVNWGCVEKVSGSSINCTSPVSTVFFNYNVVGNPYVQSLNVTGYFEVFESFNVSALQNNTLNGTFFSSNLSINSVSDVGNLSSCVYNVTGVSFPSFFEGVLGVPNASVGLINGSYSVTADCLGFAVSTSTVVISESTQYLNFTLFTVNSISFNIFDLLNLSLVQSLVEIELLGSSVTYNINTSNGSVFVDGLNSDTYKMTFSSSLYDTTILFGTISGGNHLDVDVYLKNGTDVDFVVQDQRRILLGDATLTVTQTINGSDITIGQAKTDFSGRVSIFLDDTVEYSLFVVKEGYDTFTGQVIPTQPEYVIILTKTGDERFVSIFEDLKILTSFTYVPLSGFAIAKLILNSASGSLEYYGMNTTYNGTNYFTNITSIPAGGIETFNISNINPGVEPIININYWLKYDGRVIQEWDADYLLSDVVPSNFTLVDGLFDEIQALDEFSPIRGLMGAFIILMLIMLFSTSKDTSTIVIGGIFGLAINLIFDLMPRNILVISIVILSIILVKNNVKGGK